MYMTTGKNIALTRWTFVGQVLSLLFNMLSRFVIASFQRASIFKFHGCSHCLQWFWSPRKYSLSQLLLCCWCSVAQLCQTLCNPMNSSRPGLPSPGVWSSSCSLNQWCCPANSSSDAFFSFCPQSFPASGTFPMSWLFESDDQNTGASASASVLLVPIQGWSSLRLTGLISLLSKGLPGVFSSTTVQRCEFFSILPSSWYSSHNCTWPLGRQ